MFFLQILVAVVFMAVSALIAPKPKKQKPEAARDLENPTAEAGRTKPLVQGTVTLKAPNVLWYGDKDVNTRKIKA